MAEELKPVQQNEGSLAQQSQLDAWDQAKNNVRKPSVTTHEHQHKDDYKLI
jgi:hypothetical protein